MIDIKLGAIDVIDEISTSDFSLRYSALEYFGLYSTILYQIFQKCTQKNQTGHLALNRGIWNTYSMVSGVRGIHAELQTPPRQNRAVNVTSTWCEDDLRGRVRGIILTSSWCPGAYPVLSGLGSRVVRLTPLCLGEMQRPECAYFFFLGGAWAGYPPNYLATQKASNFTTTEGMATWRAGKG